jgi:rare lipoprotein A
MLLGIVTLVTGCSTVRYTSRQEGGQAPKRKIEEVKKGTTYSGLASFYGIDFDGGPTANGETYDQTALTAAHPFLPFNTRVKVTNITNGKTVIVRVNDRGPFVPKRIIDLSKKAAEELEMLEDGVIEVIIEVVGNE